MFFLQELLIPSVTQMKLLRQVTENLNLSVLNLFVLSVLVIRFLFDALNN